MKRANMIIGGVALILAGACGDDAPEESPDQEGCEHIKEGPATALTASDTAASAPLIAADHRRYDVTLAEVGGTKGGFVGFSASTAGPHLFYLDGDVAVSFQNTGGPEITPTSVATSVSACTEVERRYEVMLGVGTHALSLGPTALGSVGIVVEEGDGG